MEVISWVWTQAEHASPLFAVCAIIVCVSQWKDNKDLRKTIIGMGQAQNRANMMLAKNLGKLTATIGGSRGRGAA